MNSEIWKEPDYTSICFRQSPFPVADTNFIYNSFNMRTTIQQKSVFLLFLPYAFPVLCSRYLFFWRFLRTLSLFYAVDIGFSRVSYVRFPCSIQQILVFLAFLMYAFSVLYSRQLFFSRFLRTLSLFYTVDICFSRVSYVRFPCSIRQIFVFLAFLMYAFPVSYGSKSFLLMRYIGKGRRHSRRVFRLSKARILLECLLPICQI